MCVDMLMYHCECTLLVARPKVAGCAYGVYACVHVCHCERTEPKSPRGDENLARDLRVMSVRESSLHYENVFSRSRPKNVHQPWPLALKLSYLRTNH